jgi:hypothetical protein
VYCQVPHSVERLDVSLGVVDIERRTYETVDPTEVIGIPLA